MSAGVFLLLLLVIAVGVVGGTAIGGWVLRPLNARGKAVGNPTQFHLVDLFCLFVVLQIPLAWSGAVASMLGLSGDWVVSGILVVYFGLLWWAGVGKLSQAGILNPWHRGLFLVVVFPGTLFGAIVCVLFAIFGLCFLVFGAREETPGVVLVLAAIELGLALCLYAFGRFTRRMAAAASNDADDQEKEQASGLAADAADRPEQDACT